MNETETIEIYLNSNNATKLYNGVSDCLYTLPNIVIDEKTEKAYINIKSAVIPYSFYTVNDNNNKLFFSIDAVNYNITISNGNYNVNTLKNELKTLLDVETSLTWTITYNSKTNKFNFKLSFHLFSFLSSSTCFELLGFENNLTYSTSNNVLTSTISINLFTVRNIYITSPNFILNNVNASLHNKSDIIASIPIKGVQNSIIFFEDRPYKTIVNHLNNITNLRIILNDEQGNIIDLNHCHYSITLEIHIIKINK